MDEFERAPTEDEILFAKQNGIPAALDNVRHGNVSDKMQEAIQVAKEITKELKGKGKKQIEVQAWRKRRAMRTMALTPATRKKRIQVVTTRTEVEHRGAETLGTRVLRRLWV